MAETLVAEDGEEIDLDNVEQAFAASMAAPPADDPEHPAPPDVPPVDPEAPFGRKVDGTPKVRPGGRPPKARVTTKAIAGGSEKDAKGDGKPPGADAYAKGLQEFLSGIALGLAVLPMPEESPLRVRCRVQAQVIRDTGDGLANGLAITAQHNGVVRWGVEKLTQGGGAWVFPAALAIMPFAIQTSMLWKAPVEGDMRVMADRVQAQATAEFKAGMGIVDEEPEAAAA